jgi:K+-sensing histidine kinase KdpD
MSLRAELQSAGTVKSFHRRWIAPITASLALVSLTTALLWLVEARLKQDHLVFIYFVPTALIAIRYGSIPTICVTIVSSFAAAYFLYPPQFSFLVASGLDLLELALFILLALLASQVVSGFANDREVAKRRRWASAALFRRKWGL